MQNKPLQILTGYGITRREFLRLSSISAAGFLTGCAVNPVTGESQLMLVSESQEIQIDKKHSPHQFSSDYGTLQDNSLNNYIDQTGKKMAALT
ncbi:MAG: twin-arginine translocation signal domain-containing protein, partial [Desulfobacterales bacterium]